MLSGLEPKSGLPLRLGIVQKEQYELFLHKQHDYGPGNISVGTMLQTPEEVKLS